MTSPSMVQWHALLDALRFLNYHKEYGRVVEAQRGDHVTYRMTLALAHNFMVLSLTEGEPRALPILASKDEPAYRWFGHLPWTAARADIERSVVQLVCPHFRADAPSPTEVGVDNAPFVLEVPLAHMLLDWLHDYPTLLTGWARASKTNDVSVVPGNIQVPLVSHLTYPEFEHEFLGVAA